MAKIISLAEYRQKQPRSQAGHLQAGTALAVHDLACAYGDRLLFADLSFALMPKEMLQLNGPNGVGKTSLLRILAGLASPSQGEVYWQNQPIATSAAAFRANVCYIGHVLGLAPNLTVRENLQAAYISGKPLSRFSLPTVAKEFGLSRYLETRLGVLSAGQRKRVALARLLMVTAPLWVLDEPLTSLDNETIAQVQQMFIYHLEMGGTIVLATHQPFALKDILIKQLNFRT